MTEIIYYPICSLEKLPVGERLFVEVDEEPIVIFNFNGDIFAIADVCTHDQGSLGDGELEGYEIVCPRHGARFDIRSGEVVTLPAVNGISTYPTRLNKGMVEIGVEA